MSDETLRKHYLALRENAAETAARAQTEPRNWLLQVAAKNQADAAADVGRQLRVSDIESGEGLIEWRLVGARLMHGEVPLSLLAKLAEPLNRLLLRAAYFARHHEDPQHGVSEDWARTMDLRLAAIAPGSARLMIRGNTFPDTTGSNALEKGVENLLGALAVSHKFSDFYERLGDIGEAASASLRDTLRALEAEECSVEVKWHQREVVRRWQGGLPEVVRLRSLLDGSVDPVRRTRTIKGTVQLLAATGRIQLLDAAGRRYSVRFNPKTQSHFVAGFRLGDEVRLAVSERVIRDPISGDELSQFRISSDGDTPPQLTDGAR